MKDLKISRELLSEVLKLEVVKHSLFNKRNNTLPEYAEAYLNNALKFLKERV